MRFLNNLKCMPRSRFLHWLRLQNNIFVLRCKNSQRGHCPRQLTRLSRAIFLSKAIHLKARLRRLIGSTIIVAQNGKSRGKLGGGRWESGDDKKRYKSNNKAPFLLRKNGAWTTSLTLQYCRFLELNDSLTRFGFLAVVNSLLNFGFLPTLGSFLANGLLRTSDSLQ